VCVCLALLFVSVSGAARRGGAVAEEASSAASAEAKLRRATIVHAHRDSAGRVRHPEAGDNVASILPYASIVEQLPADKAAFKQAKSRKGGRMFTVRHPLPLGFEHYVHHELKPTQKFVSMVKRVGPRKTAFRYHLQRHQLPVLPEPKKVHDPRVNVNDPMFYHKYVFERGPEDVVKRGPNAPKLFKPWIMPACCGKPVVKLKKKRHINSLTPISHFISTRRRRRTLPHFPAYYPKGHRRYRRHVRPIKWKRRASKRAASKKRARNNKKTKSKAKSKRAVSKRK